MSSTSSHNVKNLQTNAAQVSVSPQYQPPMALKNAKSLPNLQSTSQQPNQQTTSPSPSNMHSQPPTPKLQPPSTQSHNAPPHPQNSSSPSQTPNRPVVVSPTGTRRPTLGSSPTPIVPAKPNIKPTQNTNTNVTNANANANTNTSVTNVNPHSDPSHTSPSKEVKSDSDVIKPPQLVKASSVGEYTPIPRNVDLLTPTTAPNNVDNATSHTNNTTNNANPRKDDLVAKPATSKPKDPNYSEIPKDVGTSKETTQQQQPVNSNNKDNNSETPKSPTNSDRAQNLNLQTSNAANNANAANTPKPQQTLRMNKPINTNVTSPAVNHEPEQSTVSPINRLKNAKETIGKLIPSKHFSRSQFFIN